MNNSFKEKQGEKRKNIKKYDDVYCIYLSFFFCRKEHESIGVKRHYIPKIYKWVPLREKGVNDTRAVQ